MIEVCQGLFIGSDLDYQAIASHQNWWIIHACRDPYHRSLLGYSGRGAPRGHPEYLIAKRGKEMFLNLVDVNNPSYFSTEIIDAALDWIDQAVGAGEKVLVHCNQGESRSPAIGLLYLASQTNAVSRASLGEAEAEFVKLYPMYNPKPGIRGFLLQNWDRYIRSATSGQ